MAITTPETPRRGSGRPTASGAAELAARIIDVATAAFLADGYAASSIESIAARAGVAKRTLYARWRDKPALFRAVLERLMTRWLASEAPAASDADGLESTLVKTARHILAVALEPDALALHRLMIAESGRFPELIEMVRQAGAAAGVGRIVALLQAEMAAGRLVPSDPGVAAEQFLHLVLTGPQRRALGLGPAFDAAERDACVRAAVTLFLNGCRPRLPGINHDQSID